MQCKKKHDMSEAPIYSIAANLKCYITTFRDESACMRDIKKKEKKQIMDFGMLTSLQTCHTPVTNSFWQGKAILLNWLGATDINVRVYGSLSHKSNNSYK